MNEYFFKRSVVEHPYIKDSLIRLISESVSIHNKSNTEDHITDYHISKDLPRKYEGTVMPLVLDHMREFETKYNFGGISLHAMWFQIYKKGGFHDWHVHPFCHFTNVYYVKLPKPSLKTQIKNPFNNNYTEDIEISEGDILTFPSFFFHRSPAVMDDEEKIIISFNTNIQ